MTMTDWNDRNASPNPPVDPDVYDPAVVERKWQDHWEARGTNHTDLGDGASPFYALMMFPYPSAEGLHVGNLFAFTGNDIYGRFQRLQGHTVFEPLATRDDVQRCIETSLGDDGRSGRIFTDREFLTTNRCATQENPVAGRLRRG